MDEKFGIKLGLVHMVAMDYNGQSGGLELFWRCGIKLSLRWKSRMNIDTTIPKEDYFKWHLT